MNNDDTTTPLHFTNDDIKGFDRFYRANLINSISGYKPAMLIGSQNRNGQTNLAMFSSIVHLGADPALIGFIQRPVGVSGDTFRNISETSVYTLNHIHVSFLEQAHYTSARFPSDVSEFAACGFTPGYIEGFAAPFVQESLVKLGLELVEIIPIVHNDTKLVIGKVQHMLIGEGLLTDTGNIDTQKLDSVCISGLEHYYRPIPLASFPYAKVENLPRFS